MRGLGILATSGWLGGAGPVELVFPPVEELAGWPESAVLTSIGVRWQLFLRRANHGATPHLPGHQPRLPEGDGVVLTYAATAGFVE